MVLNRKMNFKTNKKYNVCFPILMIYPLNFKQRKIHLKILDMFDPKNFEKGNVKNINYNL